MTNFFVAEVLGILGKSLEIEEKQGFFVQVREVYFTLSLEATQKKKKTELERDAVKKNRERNKEKENK